MNTLPHCENVLGAQAVEAMTRAKAFLDERDTTQLLHCVGTTRQRLALSAPAAGKTAFPRSYASGKPCDQDLLAGKGVFYVTQDGTIMLDCTGGHYQMTWGYNHPELCAAARQAMDLGIVWDNHSNAPSLPVKQLADELVALTRDAGFDRVHLGMCTGSAVCAAALKIMLARYAADTARAALGPPIVVSLKGNYHGTDIAAQTMRGMWPGLLAHMAPVQVEPNDAAELTDVFKRFPRRIAGFWAEPVMMNREALLVDKAYLRLARDLCTRHGALMALDEIQTGFWYPEVFLFRRLEIAPDFVIVGKGMTAGFHPLAALLYRAELDILEQYDAISTNGNASLAAFIALCNLRLIAREATRLARTADGYFNGLRELAAEFPDLIEKVNGLGLLAGLKFRRREDAIGCHAAAVARGLWVRVHAYHEGHRTVLTKHALAADETVVAYVLQALRELLRAASWR